MAGTGHPQDRYRAAVIGLMHAVSLFPETGDGRCAVTDLTLSAASAPLREVDLGEAKARRGVGRHLVSSDGFKRSVGAKEDISQLPNR